MATINNIVICDSVQLIQRPNGGTGAILIDPQPRLRPKYIPGLLSFAISFGVLDEIITNIKNVEVKMFLTDENNPCAQMKREVAFDDLTGIDPEDTLPTLNFDFRNIEITEEGLYTIWIFINGEHVCSYNIEVKKAK